METYHHGDLRRAILDAAVLEIEENGIGAMTMRHLARRVGVSHAAPAHHFGDKAGLLTALAIEAFDRLTDQLLAVEPTDDLVESGVAYVRFALDHPAHFAVMFRPEQHRAGDTDLQAAQHRTWVALERAVGNSPETERAMDETHTTVAAWSLVHGFAALWLQNVMPEQIGEDPEAAARRIASGLFSGA